MIFYEATKTVAAIDRAIEADQGNAYRGHLKRVLPYVEDIYKQDEEAFRTHMGASILGHDCPRAIWYTFHWFSAKSFPGRIIRLFNRGHMEEARVIAALLTIDVQVFQQDKDGKQFRVSHANGHIGGSGDGVVLGVPDLTPETPALLEIKTINDKGHGVLSNEEKGGIRETKFVHYVQMNIYMYKMGIPVGLYMSVNKNDDHYHAELISLDKEITEEYLERGTKIVNINEPPMRISDSPGFWKCKFCDHHPVCHLKKKPSLNCRSCQHSVAELDGTWACHLHKTTLTKEQQLAACPYYLAR